MQRDKWSTFVKYLLSLVAIVLGIQGALAVPVLATTKITFADTILAKVVSEIYGYPIVLVDRDSLSNETIQELRDLNTTEIIIIGGPYVVTPKVEDELKNLGYNVTRIWGVTRYETSALVAKFFWEASDEAILITSDLANERVGIKDVSLVRNAVEEAIEEGIPILITPVGTLEDNVADALVTLGVRYVTIYTKAKNLGNLTRELSNLNITFEIKNKADYKTINCTKIIKIAVPENVNWTFARPLLAGFRCLEIVPVPSNATLEELQGEYDYVVLNEEALKNVKKIIISEFKEKIRRIARKRIEDIFEERIDKVLYDLDKEIMKLEEVYNETKNPRILRLIRMLKESREEIIEEVREGDIKDAVRKAIKAMNKIRMEKWVLGTYRRELRIREIKKVKERYRRKYIESLKDVFNLTEEDIEALKAKDPHELKAKIMEKILEKSLEKRGYCINLPAIACNPVTGECRRFGSICNIPRGWKIVKNPGKYRRILREEMMERIKREMRKAK